MKNKLAVWAVQRTHKVTGKVFYLSPGTVNWISVAIHEKYHTRYGRWEWSEADLLRNHVEKYYPDFTYDIVLHEKVK